MPLDIPQKNHFIKCAQCKFYERQPDGRGLCYRYPPQTSSWSVMTQTPQGGVVPQVMTNSAYPIVQPTQWCGEFILSLVTAESTN